MATVSISQNGPFDPRITSIPFTQMLGGSKKLTRGYIIQEKPVGGVRYRCSFLYNPSVVSISHGVNGNVVSDENALDANDVSGVHKLMPLQQTLNFTILFDRTYELWDPSKLHGAQFDAVTRWGVAYDVLSLYKITGIATPMEISGSDDDATGSSLEAFAKGSFKNGPVGPMLYVPVYCIIGTSLSFYGVIQNLDVQYTHWTQDMIPSRAQVGITVQMLPSNSSAAVVKSFDKVESHVASTFNREDDSTVAPKFNSGAGRGGR